MFGKYVLDYCQCKGLSIYKYNVRTFHSNYFKGIDFDWPYIDISFSDTVESELISKMLKDLECIYTPIIRISNHIRLIHTSDFRNWYIYEKGVNLSLHRCEHAAHLWHKAEKEGRLDEIKHQTGANSINDLLAGIMYAYEGMVLSNWKGEMHDLEYVGD